MSDSSSAPSSSSFSRYSSFDVASAPSSKSRGLTQEEVAAAGVKFKYAGAKGGKKEESEEDERTANTTDTLSSSSQGEAKWTFDNPSQEQQMDMTTWKIEV
eukprot:158059-Hanusia_phi.AAC.1